MEHAIWKLPPGAVLVLEAKDEYPIGTVRKYQGKYPHLYVKVGGKKPWVYYATIGTAKADAAVKAGGVIVKDGKAVTPATSDNLALHKVAHPFHGSKVAPPEAGYELPSGVKVGGEVPKEKKKKAQEPAPSEPPLPSPSPPASGEVPLPYGPTAVAPPDSPSEPPVKPSFAPKTPPRWKAFLKSAVVADLVAVADKLVAYPHPAFAAALKGSDVSPFTLEGKLLALFYPNSHKDTVVNHLVGLGMTKGKAEIIVADVLSGASEHGLLKVTSSGSVFFKPLGPAIAPAAPLSVSASAPPSGPPEAAVQDPSALSPETVPEPPSQKVADLVAFLKSVGFDNPEKQKRAMSSPTFVKHMVQTFGKDWLSLYLHQGYSVSLDHSIDAAPAVIDPLAAADAPTSVLAPPLPADAPVPTPAPSTLPTTTVYDGKDYAEIGDVLAMLPSLALESFASLKSWAEKNPNTVQVIQDAWGKDWFYTLMLAYSLKTDKEIFGSWEKALVGAGVPHSPVPFFAASGKALAIAAALKAYEAEHAHIAQTISTNKGKNQAEKEKQKKIDDALASLGDLKQVASDRSGMGASYYDAKYGVMGELAHQILQAVESPYGPKHILDVAQEKPVVGKEMAGMLGPDWPDFAIALTKAFEKAGVFPKIKKKKDISLGASPVSPVPPLSPVPDFPPVAPPEHVALVNKVNTAIQGGFDTSPGSVFDDQMVDLYGPGWAAKYNQADHVVGGPKTLGVISDHPPVTELTADVDAARAALGSTPLGSQVQAKIDALSAKHGSNWAKKYQKANLAFGSAFPLPAPVSPEEEQEKLVQAVQAVLSTHAPLTFGQLLKGHTSGIASAFGKDWEQKYLEARYDDLLAAVQAALKLSSFPDEAALVDPAKLPENVRAALASDYGPYWKGHYHKAQTQALLKAVDKALENSSLPLDKLKGAFADEMKAKYGVQWKAKYKKAKYVEAPVAPSSPTPTPSVGAPPIAAAPAVAVSVPHTGTLPPPNVPELSAMTYGGPAKLGGAGEKHFYNDPATGKQYLLKLAYEKDATKKAKPFAAIAQEVFATVSQAVKPDRTVPIRHFIRTQNGKQEHVTLQPMIPKKGTLQGVSPAKLSMAEKQDVASEHILDWLMGQHDSHADNLLRLHEGGVLGVDKEQAFRFMVSDVVAGTDQERLSLDYKPNPETPYYNSFWSAFSDGKFDFDPKAMLPTLEAIEALSDQAYVEQLRRYADDFFKNSPNLKDVFLKRAFARKKNLRADFETFLTMLHRKRLVHPKGTYTFAAGWDPTGAIPITPYVAVSLPSGGEPVAPVEAASPPKKKIVKYSAADYALAAGVMHKVYLPTQGPDQGKGDPTKYVVRISKGTNEAKLSNFLKEMGLSLHPEHPAIIYGQSYTLVVVKKADWDAAFVEKEEIQPIIVDAADVAAGVDVTEPGLANINSDELYHIEDMKLGHVGKNFSAGSPLVEGHVLKGRRILEANGEVAYLFQFKLRGHRRGSGSNIYYFDDTDVPPGQSAYLPMPRYNYVIGTDAMKEKAASPISTLSGEKWTAGNSEIFFQRKRKPFTYMGTVVAKVRPKPGQSVRDAFAEALEAMKPGLSKEVLRNPTPEEQEVVKLARLLWAVAPQVSDSLKKAEYTVEKLRAELAKVGYSPEKIDKVELRVTTDGHVSHVLPGRWKEMGARFVYNGIKADDQVPSILRSGVLAISERVCLGVVPNGISISEDTNNGAGDQALCRVATNHSNSFHWSWPVQAIVAPTELDRLDCYMYSGDSYGCSDPDDGPHGSAWRSRQPVSAVIPHAGDGNEIMFRKGIDSSRILRLVVQSEQHRKSLIQKLINEGFVEANGVPISDFVVVASNISTAAAKLQKVLAQATSKGSL